MSITNSHQYNKPGGSWYRYLIAVPVFDFAVSVPVFDRGTGIRQGELEHECSSLVKLP